MTSSRQVLAGWDSAIMGSVVGIAEKHTASISYLGWRALYMAALFETDEEQASQRITEAKMALARRAHELFHSPGDHAKERSEIEATVQALHALERCRTVLVRPMVVRTRIEDAIASIEPACAD